MKRGFFRWFLVLGSLALNLPSVATEWNPTLCEKEASKYKFDEIKYTDIDSLETKKVTEVPMGGFSWGQKGESCVFTTKNINDCVAVIFRGPKIGLSHVAYGQEDHALFEEELSKIENIEKYEIFLISKFYSKNLDQIVSIINDQKGHITGADIWPNYADVTKGLFGMQLFGMDPVKCLGEEVGKKCIKSEKIRVEVLSVLSRQVAICLETGNISQKF